jgi:predicted permease
MFGRRRRSELDFADEVQSHIAHEVDRLMARGISESDARAAAHRVFGSVFRAREQHYQSSRWLWVDHMWEDLRHAMRGVRNAPGLAAAVIVSLGLGIGLNTTVFTWLYSFRRPLPLPDAARLVTIHHEFNDAFDRTINGDRDMVSFAEFTNYRDHARSLDGLAAYATMGFTLRSEVPVAGTGLLVTCGYFRVLRAGVALGRTFAEDECRRGNDAVAVLQHGYWLRQFGGDSAIIGRTIVLNRQALRVIGVTERGFGGTALRPVDLWVPVSMREPLSSGGDLLRGPMLHGGFGDGRVTRASSPSQRSDVLGGPYEQWLALIGRLAPHATMGGVKAELAAIAGRVDRLYGDRRTTVRMLPMARGGYRRQNTEPVIVLAAMSVIVLIACLNVMSLLLARAPARQRAVRIRLAMGARRGRIIAHLLTESIVLGFLGGGAGVALAVWLSRAGLSVFYPTGVQLDVSPDLRILVYALLTTIGATILFGLAPALETTRVDLASAMRGDTGSVPGRGSALRQGVVALQIAGSFALLVLAGLFVRSVQRAYAIDPGFVIAGIHAFRPALAQQNYDGARAALFRAELKSRAAALPGVESVSLAQSLPLSAHSLGMLELEDTLERVSLPRHAAHLSVDSSYFPAMGIRIMRGRGLVEADARAAEPRAAVISQTMARSLWPGMDPLGRRFLIASDTWYEVVGVVTDARNVRLSDAEPIFFYRAFPLGGTLIVRAAPGVSLDRQIKRMAAALDPNVLVTSRSLAEELDSDLRSTRLAAIFAAILGLLATVLAAVGVYGAIDYNASQRRREIGLRLTLGATPRDVVVMVMRAGLAPILTGLLIGAGLAVVAARVTRSLLFGLSPLDPVAYFGMSGLLMLVALVAMYRPSRRAARLDPSCTLRSD